MPGKIIPPLKCNFLFLSNAIKSIVIAVPALITNNDSSYRFQAPRAVSQRSTPN